MGMIAAFVFLISFLYAFALQAKYENTFIKTLRNSADISMRYFVRTLSLIFILAIELVVIFWNPITLFVGILIGPACIIYTISGYARYFFREIEREPGSLKEQDKQE